MDGKKNLHAGARGRGDSGPDLLRTRCPETWVLGCAGPSNGRV